MTRDRTRGPFGHSIRVQSYNPVPPDDRQPSPGRDRRRGRRSKVECPAGGVGIPWSPVCVRTCLPPRRGRQARTGRQLAVPAVLGLPLHVEPRETTAEPHDGVLARLGVLLLRTKHQHGGIDVDNQPRRGLRFNGHLPQEPVVPPPQARQGDGGDPEQEPAQLVGFE